MEAAPTAFHNVVLVTIDTLRADHLSFYGYELETSPFLARLAQESAIFESALATSSWTAPSTASIFTGQYPTQHGLRMGFFVQRERLEKVEREGGATLSLDRIAPGLETLPERFRTSGYTTFGLSANVNIGPELGFDEGFDHFERLHGLEIMQSGTADQIFEQIEAWEPLLREHQPYFLYLHFNDVHEPYERKAPWYGDYRRQNGNKRDAAYDSQINYVDQVLAKSFQRFGWDRDAIAVIVADHGEALGDHGHQGHGFYLYHELVRVPWMVHAPSLGLRPQRIQENVSQIDLLPTLAMLAGLEADKTLPGLSLVPLLRGGDGAKALREELATRYLFAHRVRYEQERSRHKWAVVQSTWKLIQDEGDLELFDLEQDPLESRSVVAEHPERVQAMLKQLGDFRSAASWDRGEQITVNVDVENIEALRALGYVD